MFLPLSPYRSCLAVSAALITTLAVSHQALGQEVDLRPKFEPGSSSTLVMKIKSTNKVQPAGGLAPGGQQPGQNPGQTPGQSPGTKPKTPGGPSTPAQKPAADTSTQVTEQEITLSEKVIDFKPEVGATVQLVYQRVKVKIKTEELGDFEYDSDAAKTPAPGGNPGTTPGGKSPPGTPGKTPPGQLPPPKKDPLDAIIEQAVMPDYSGVVGTVLTLKVDPNGNITSVTGGENLAKGGLMGAMGSLPANADSFKGLFGPIRPDAANSTGKPSSKPGFAKVGDKWSTSDTVSVGPMGDMRLTTEHTVKSVKGTEAEIGVVGKAQSASLGNPGSTPGAAPGGHPSVTIPTSNYRGTYMWDSRRGQLRSMLIEQQTEAESPLGRMFSDSTITVDRNADRGGDRLVPKR